MVGLKGGYRRCERAVGRRVARSLPAQARVVRFLEERGFDPRHVAMMAATLELLRTMAGPVWRDEA